MNDPKDIKPGKPVVQELKRIAAEHGGVLQPEDVVEEARPRTSPLHSRFEWSDTKAAKAYRLWQARQLIRVVVEVDERVRDPYNVFVSLTDDRRGAGGYRVTTEVLSDAQMRKRMLADALAELRSFQEKYRRLTELAEVFKAIRRVQRGR